MSATTKRNKGFTLIELLIVIVILGILAAVIVSRVSGISDTGAQVACKAEVATVDSAIEQYRAKNGAYAPDLATLASAGFLKSAPSVKSASGAGTYTAVTGTYTPAVTPC